MQKTLVVLISLLLGAIPPGVSVAVFGFGYDFLDLYPFIMSSLALLWALVLLGLAHAMWSGE